MSTKQTEIEKLVESFAHHVSAQTDTLFRAVKTSNKHADKAVAAFKKLCAYGDTGRDALMILFSHPRPDVRSTTAAFLLRHCTKEAQTVLREVAAGEGLTAFGASEALKRWEEGTWALDPG